MDGQLMESVGGLLIFAALFVLVIRAKRRWKKREGVPQSGLSQIQYQALVRQLSGMNQILRNVMPDEGGSGAKVTERRKRK